MGPAHPPAARGTRQRRGTTSAGPHPPTPRARFSLGQSLGYSELGQQGALQARA